MVSDLSTTYCWILGIIPVTIDFMASVGRDHGCDVDGLGCGRLALWRLSIRWRTRAGLGRFGSSPPSSSPILLPGSRSALDPLIARWDLFQAPSTGGPLGRLSDEWHGETFYARNLEWQISDSKRLRQIVDRPGTPGSSLSSRALMA